MARIPMSSGREFNPWPALILLPVLIVFGWLFSRVPSPRHDAINAGSGSRDSSASVATDAPAGASDDSARLASPDTLASGGLARNASAAGDLAGRSNAPAEHGLYSRWTTLENAMEESQHDGKPVLIDFNADWCGPCQAMKREVFDDVDRGRQLQDAVIPVSIVDRVKEEGQNPPDIDELQKRFQVEAFPTLVMFSPKSGRSMVAEGYSSPDQALQWILAAAKAVR